MEIKKRYKEKMEQEKIEQELSQLIAMTLQLEDELNKTIYHLD